MSETKNVLFEQNYMINEELRPMESYVQGGNLLTNSDLSCQELTNLAHEIIKNTSGRDIVVLARTTMRFYEVLPQNPFSDADTL